MIPFTPGELEMLAAPNFAAMQDELVHVPQFKALDGYNELRTDWENAPDGGTYSCGFRPLRSDEKAQALASKSASSADVVTIDARVRLPLELEGVIGEHDRVRITRRFDRLLVQPLVFDVVGKPRIGPTGLELDLREVVT